MENASRKTLMIVDDDAGPARSISLGSDGAGNEELQGLVPTGAWQAARPAKGGSFGYSLVSCIVVPGFDVAGFELAPPGWKPGKDMTA